VKCSVGVGTPLTARLAIHGPAPERANFEESIKQYKHFLQLQVIQQIIFKLMVLIMKSKLTPIVIKLIYSIKQKLSKYQH